MDLQEIPMFDFILNSNEKKRVVAILMCRFGQEASMPVE